MKLLLLPGNSKYNKSWIEEVHGAVQHLFHDAKILYYSHWEHEEEIDIDLDHEITKLKAMVEVEEEFVVFAKSAGSLATLKAIHTKVFKPKKVIIVGFPLLWARERNYEVEPWLETVDIDLTFIHKTNDPIFSFAELQQFLKQFPNLNHELIELPGDDHHYEDIEGLKNIFIRS